MRPGARTRWLRGLLLALAIVGGTYEAARLPSGPDAVWAPNPVTIDPKPWAQVSERPGGERLDAAWGWFVAADGSWTYASDRWDETLHVVLECDTPVVRRVLDCLAGGNGNNHSVFAKYRPTTERVVVGGDTWTRYVRD